MRSLARAVALIILLAAHGIAHAGDWNVGLKRLILRDPVGGGAMTGMVTYPTAAAAKSLTVGRFRTMAAEDAAPAVTLEPGFVLHSEAGVDLPGRLIVPPTALRRPAILMLSGDVPEALAARDQEAQRERAGTLMHGHHSLLRHFAGRK